MAQPDKDLGAEIPELGGGASPLRSSEAWRLGDALPIDVEADAAGRSGQARAFMAGSSMAVHATDVAIAVPPERVRFYAPALVRPEGSGDASDGRVLNLSAQGLACAAAVQLTVGERVWLHFRLALADEPVDLLCEVIWSSHPPRGEPLYGLRFAGLTQEESAGVRRAVQERTEGRAGEWPLPLLPEPGAGQPDEPVPVAARGASPWVVASAGMAAGIGLTLLLSALAPPGGGEIEELATNPLGDEAVVECPAAPPAPPPGNGAAMAESQQPAAGSGSDASARPSDPPSAEPMSTKPPGPAASERPAADAVAQPSPAPTKRPSQRAAPPRAASGLVHASSSGDAVTLELGTDGSVLEHVAFWLSKPRRLVVDVPGRRSSLGRQTIQVDHPLVKRIRVGQHRTQVRFVVETVDAVEPDAVVKHHGNAVMVTIRRKR